MSHINLPLPFESYTGSDPYVFVSYSHADASEVFDQLKALHKRGYRIWYDDGIGPSHVWTDAIAEALVGAACFLVFLSASAVHSQNVRNEIEFALKREKPFFAIYLSDVKLPPGLELQTARIQAIMKWKMSNEYYFHRLEKALPEGLINKNAADSTAIFPINDAQRAPVEDGHNATVDGNKKFRPLMATAALSAVLIIGSLVYYLSDNPSPINTNENGVQSSPTAVNQGGVQSAPGSQIDQYGRSFTVYSDNNTGSNHFIPSGWIGDTKSLSCDENWKDTPHSGSSSIKMSFTANRENWVGMYWQSIENNWGNDPFGYDLTGAHKVIFFARGDKGGEKVEFFAGGITGTYPDSFPKTSTGLITLSTKWQQYELDLSNQSLSHVVGGFGFACNAAENPNGAVFYLDDIAYN